MIKYYIIIIDIIEKRQRDTPKAIEWKSIFDQQKNNHFRIYINSIYELG